MRAAFSWDVPVDPAVVARQVCNVIVVVVVVVVVVVSRQLLSNILSPWSHKGAGALGRSEKPNKIKNRPGNTTLSRLKRTIRRRRTSEMIQCAN